MAVGQENKGKKKDFHDFFRMAEKQKAQADNSEFLTDESPNAAKHWGFCHRKGWKKITPAGGGCAPPRRLRPPCHTT